MVIEWIGPRTDSNWQTRRRPEHRFRLESDDGAILYIDGKALINNDGSHSARTREAFVPLKKGKHALRLDYFQDTEEFTLSLQVQKPGMRMEPIPVSALWHE